MVILTTQYNVLLVLMSIGVAIFASYVALDLVHSVTHARGRMQGVWLAFGAVVMGAGIWSMHFVGMLAFNMPGVPMSYDVPLMLFSIFVAVGASALALFIMSRPVVPIASLVAGGIAMAVAISGMHYTGMVSMRMPARIEWNLYLVATSVLIALLASFSALMISLRLRDEPRPALHRISAVIMGLAISGMHYMGMAAATFIATDHPVFAGDQVLPSSGLGLAVAGGTAIILGVALAVSVLDRAFSSGRKKVADMTAERELRERFVSALAHDLRNPLSAAKMSASLILRGAEDPDLVRKFSTKVIHNIDRMDQMVQDLLDAHRITVGQQLPLQLQPVRLGELLQETVEDLTTSYGNRFVLDCPQSLRGEWDSKYLRRAVENLCTNAIKYGSDSTPVRIAADELESGDVRITVQNEGPPIAPGELPHLFEMFHRGGLAERQGKRGWGLGLSIVKGTVEAHGGVVAVRSNTEEGTVFTIRLPRSSPKPGLKSRVLGSGTTESVAKQR
jgi:NO-binding membrane sensor protein with MHYT domain/nitrogen-specific signal transduction histidine kinase